MNTTSHALILAVGVGVGAAAGWQAQCAVRAWTDYRAAKAQVPVLLAAARALTRNAAGVVLLAAAFAAFALYVASA
ncbi:MAG: hypothetical protein ACRDT8_22840 [Micromonosporaceae bacterium]